MIQWQKTSTTFWFRVFGHGLLFRKSSGLTFRDSYRSVKLGGLVIKLLLPARFDEGSCGTMTNNKTPEGKGGV